MTTWLCIAGAVGVIVTLVTTLARPPTILHRSLIVAGTLPFLVVLAQAALRVTFTIVDAFRAMRRRHQAFWSAVAAWQRREPFADDRFLDDCHLPPGDLPRKIALAARAALANQAAGVPPQSIHPDDALAEPLWHGVWWEDVYFQIEADADAKVTNWSFRPALGDQVRDLLHFVASRATPLPPSRKRRCKQTPLIA